MFQSNFGGGAIVIQSRFRAGDENTTTRGYVCSRVCVSLDVLTIIINPAEIYVQAN